MPQERPPARKASAPVIRRFWLRLHRWTGVVTGLVVAVLAVTGGLLVFEKEYDRLMHPEFFPAQSAAQPLTPGQCLDVLYRQRGGMPIAGLLLPRQAGDPLLVHSTKTLYVDPADGHVLGIRSRADGHLQTIVKLHASLLQGTWGREVVSAVTALTLVMAVTGLWLWWPLRIWSFRRGASFRRWNLDLHSVAGLYSSLFLLVVAGTGTTMAYCTKPGFRSWFYPLIGATLPPGPPLSQRPPDGAHRISVDRAIDAAEAALPGAKAVSLEMPQRPNVAFHLQLAFPEDRSPAGRSIVNLDQYTGEPLQVLSTRDGSLGSRYIPMQLQIHTGMIGGMPTKVMAFLVCLALLLQVLSGYVLWWRRR